MADGDTSSAKRSESRDSFPHGYATMPCWPTANAGSWRIQTVSLRGCDFPRGRIRLFSPACWVPEAHTESGRPGAMCLAVPMRTGPSSGANVGSPTAASSSAARPWPIQGDRTAPSILRRVSALDGDAHLSAIVSLAGDYGRQPSGLWHRDGPVDAWETSLNGIHARWSGAIGAVAVERAEGPAILLDLRLGRGDSHDFVLELQRTRFEAHDRAAADDLWRQTAKSWARMFRGAVRSRRGATSDNPSPFSAD